MTDGDGRKDAEAADALRTLLRRARHELRNAQSAAAVNLEVVKSRVAAGVTDSEALKPFAENAAQGLRECSSIAEGTMALCGVLMTALSSGGVIVRRETDGKARSVELTMPRDAAERLISALKASGVIGLGVEASSTGVILQIPPDNETN